MAVCAAYTFDYEVRVAPGNDGSFEGTAASVQEKQGMLPGLAGPGPLVRIAGDRVEFLSQVLQSTAGRVIESLLVLIPPLCNLWIDRRLRQASVRRIDLCVPGLSEVIEAGHILRAALECDHTGTPLQPLVAEVSLLASNRVTLREWHGVPVLCVPIPGIAST
ncbi:MAG: hypothetical protein JW940_31790 [Polyangiaceae bacterium]|nr:hypothetical protein [Polyangiaceae bacterium]